MAPPANSPMGLTCGAPREAAVTGPGAPGDWRKDGGERLNDGGWNQTAEFRVMLSNGRPPSLWKPRRRDLQPTLVVEGTNKPVVPRRRARAGQALHLFE